MTFPQEQGYTQEDELVGLLSKLTALEVSKAGNDPYYAPDTPEDVIASEEADLLRRLDEKDLRYVARTALASRTKNNSNLETDAGELYERRLKILEGIEELLKDDKQVRISRIFPRIREFLHEASIDMQNASKLEKLAFAAGCLVVGGHLFGAETLYSNLGTNIYKNTDHSNWIINTLTTGAALGGASMALETASTFVVASTVESFPRTGKFLNRFYSKKAGIELESDINSKNDYVESKELEFTEGNDQQEGVALEGSTTIEKVESVSMLLALGSPGRVIKHHVNDPSKGFRQRVKSGLPAIKFLAIANFGLGAAVAAFTRLSPHLSPSLQNFILKGETQQYIPYIAPASGLFPILKDPLFWWTAFGAIHFSKKGIHLTHSKTGVKEIKTELISKSIEANT